MHLDMYVKLTYEHFPMLLKILKVFKSFGPLLDVYSASIFPVINNTDE